jgi:predicted TIM-barrel fold metal-dependent hydrolase
MPEQRDQAGAKEAPDAGTCPGAEGAAVMITDVNVTLSRWPFRRLIGDEPADLVARLRLQNVSQAWAGSFDGIFHKDMAGVNARLARDCRAHGPGFLLPFGSINPKLPDWQEDLRRCHEEHQMPGIRLYPNYHGYDLGDPAFKELLDLAATRGLIVQLALCMEDVRTQHPLMRVPPVDFAPLADLVKPVPKLRLVVLNCYPTLKLESLERLSSAGEVFFEFSMVERVGGLERLTQQVSLQRVLFGSNYPLFYFESALFKVRESGLTEAQKKGVFEENARRLYTQ